jgi:hypothetical protein
VSVIAVRLLPIVVVAALVGFAGPARAQKAAESGDTRRPVPLTPMMALHQKQNMRDHLLAIQEIVGALAARDFAAAAKSAARIGSSPQAEQMCAHMGAAAPGFAEKGMLFHRTADRIIEAAERRDLDASLRAVSETLSTCDSCHREFRQAITDYGAR